MSSRESSLMTGSGIIVNAAPVAAPLATRPRFAPVRNEGTLQAPGADFLAALGIGSTGMSAKVNEMTALGVSTVFACVDYIARIISTLPVELYRQTAQGKQIATGHAARRVVKFRPNPIMVPSDVRYALAYNQALHGNAYAQLVFNRLGEPMEMYPIRPRNVQMTLLNNFWPQYQVSGDGTRTQTLNFDEMLHLKGMTPDGLKGQGPLGVVSNLIGLAQALEDNAGRFFANGSRPGMIYSAAPGIVLTDTQRTALREQLESAYKGVENFFKTMVLEGGGKVEMTRSSNESSQFEEITQRTHQQICQVFGVPPHKVGILDNATFSNIEQQQIQAVQDLFLPWCKRWEEALGGALLEPGEQEAFYFKFNLSGILRGDVVARYQSYSTALQNGIMSINEVRALEDLDPVEGGDTHVRQLNMADITAPPPEPPEPRPPILEPPA